MRQGGTPSTRARFGIATLVAVVAVFAVAAALPQAASAREPDRVCGIEPGEGSFNYVAVWDVSCRYARKISRKAGREFCGDHYQHCDDPPGTVDSGTVTVRNWTCKMRVGYESYRARCNKAASDKRFLHKSGS